MESEASKRRRWKRARDQFKYGMRVRLKLGILLSVCEDVAKKRRAFNQWDRPEWDEKWVNLIYTSLRDEQIPHELLVSMTQCATVQFLTPDLQPTPEAVVEFSDELLRKLSKPLRIKFGLKV